MGVSGTFMVSSGILVNSGGHDTRGITRGMAVLMMNMRRFRRALESVRRARSPLASESGLALHERDARAYIYSSRSGCSRTMRAHSGWNWNQPAMWDPICCWVTAALAASIFTGAPDRFGHELGLAASFHGDEPPGGLVHRMAYRQQAVITEDDGFLLAQSFGDALAFGSFVNHSGEIREQRMVFVEGAGVLGDRVEQAAERRPCFPYNEWA